MSLSPARGWLIDTNVVFELSKGRRAAEPIRIWAESVAPTSCYLSRVTIAEIRFGIERVTDPNFRAELEAWLRDGLLPWFGARIIDVDERVLVRWRQMVWEGQKAGYTHAQPDALLAATALVHELAVVTRNTADFERAGVRLRNPWTEEARQH
jgi:predicted nucleic acid-binding protein